MRRSETPVKRRNPGGDEVFVARYTNREGRRKSAGTFERHGPCKKPVDNGTCCAQHRIWWAYEQDVPVAEKPVTVREYGTETWLKRHPRAERTELNYRSRLRGVLEVRTTDGVFGDLVLAKVKPRHLDDLVDALLRGGRAASGTRGVLAVLSAMFMDAIRDELAEMNPALVVSVRDSDPRVSRTKRKKMVLSWQEAHAFAAAGGEHEAAIRVLADCGLRLGELLGLECKHVRGDVLVVEQHAWRGAIVARVKCHEEGREVPIPPVLATLLAAAKRDRIGVLFPAPDGGVWHERSFYRYAWNPARAASGRDLNPHDLRHSWVSNLRAAGVDPADLAKMAGHSLQTATGVYTHSTGATFEMARKAVGE